MSPPQDTAPDHPLEKDPAVEWGEGLYNGKVIARGGKQTGHVPGASPSTSAPQPKPHS